MPKRKKKTDDSLHSEGGTTTKDDATDVGVPMLPGDPAEAQGPEDAFGDGKKRGDYTDRQDGLQHYEMRRDEDGNVVAVDQNANVGQIGDEAGKKGGVETSGGPAETVDLPA